MRGRSWRVCLAMSGPTDMAASGALWTVEAADMLALGPMAARLPHAAPDLARRPGVTATRPRGQGHEIREVRPFSEGDDLRHLDAAATARTGFMQVRSFHEDRDRTVMLIADFRRPMLWGTVRFRSVAAAEALAVAGWQAVADGGAAGVAVLTDAGIFSEKPASRSRGMARVAGCLARGHTVAGQSLLAPVRDLDADLIRAARLAPRGATILLASALDQPGPGFDAALGAILRRGPLRLFLMQDPFELAPPRGSLPYRTAAGLAARGGFANLPARRAALVDRLQQMGVGVECILTDRSVGQVA